VAQEFITLPQAALRLGKSRQVIERLITQYTDRIPSPERVGITRVWPSSLIEILSVILREEDRLQGRRFWA
jgi:predicted DNA-binding transcriptional regulator AlpA